MAMKRIAIGRRPRLSAALGRRSASGPQEDERDDG